MTSRTNFIKSELEKIYNLLNESFEYAVLARLEDNRKFIRIIELLIEISEKSNTLQQVVKGRYFV